MAAQIAALNPKLPPTLAGQLLRDFVDAFDSVQEQLRKGTTQAVVPLTKISLLGTEGVAILKKHLEDATNARFTFSVDASANSVTLMPTGPMPPKPAVTAQSLALPAGNASKTAGSKVPRPPNAFIIYRKEWHPRVVAQNPGLHNNAISVIIGEKWRAEDELVRAEYKQKAEETKRQHAINNPGYQYQPRKPSEKKKRMTKNKLAKLTAKAEENGNIFGDIVQQPLPDDFDPVAMLDEHLGSCANAQPLSINAQPLSINAYGQILGQQSPTLLNTNDPDFVAFIPGPDPEGTLRSSLEAFNAAHPTPNNTAGATTIAHSAQATKDGSIDSMTRVQGDLPGVGFYDDAITTAGTDSFCDQLFARATTPTTTSIAPHDPYVEVRRQDRLQLEFNFNNFFDLEAASSSDPNSTDAAGANNFSLTDNYEFEHDGNHMQI